MVCREGEPLPFRQLAQRVSTPRDSWSRLSCLLAVNLAVKWPCRRVKRTRSETNALVSMVGREGLEPPTPCASCRCSSQLS